MDEIERSKAEAQAKRDRANQRVYRRNDRRFTVTALTPGERYRVSQEHNEAFPKDYYARTCDEAMTKHIEEWNV